MRSDSELRALAYLRIEGELVFACDDVPQRQFIVLTLMDPEQAKEFKADVDSGKIAAVFERRAKMANCGFFFSCEFMSRAEVAKFNSFIDEIKLEWEKTDAAQQTR